MNKRTYVGLDVHARSVKGCAIDRETGEILRQSLAANDAGVAEWVSGLPGPVLVVYEAGPTGFGLARLLTAAGIECLVAAPSKLQRPSGDRIKTDVRDAEHLARLALLGQVSPVRVPGRADEAARDLVRAREDVRADLMRARHRVSKLLLRHGLIYSGGQAWTDAHHTWLHRQHFDNPALQAAYEASLETAELTLDRRNRLDAKITALAATDRYAPVVHALMCLRGISVLTALASRWKSVIGPASPATPSAHIWAWSPPSIPPVLPGPKAGSPRPATPTPADYWSRPPGTTAGPITTSAVTCGPLGHSRRGVPGPWPPRQPPAAPQVGAVRSPTQTPGHRQRRRRPGTGWLVLVPRRPGTTGTAMDG